MCFWPYAETIHSLYFNISHNLNYQKLFFITLMSYCKLPTSCTFYHGWNLLESGWEIKSCISPSGIIFIKFMFLFFSLLETSVQGPTAVIKQHKAQHNQHCYHGFADLTPTHLRSHYSNNNFWFQNLYPPHILHLYLLSIVKVFHSLTHLNAGEHNLNKFSIAHWTIQSVRCVA